MLNLCDSPSCSLQLWFVSKQSLCQRISICILFHTTTFALEDKTLMNVFTKFITQKIASKCSISTYGETDYLSFRSCSVD